MSLFEMLKIYIYKSEIFETLKKNTYTHTRRLKVGAETPKHFSLFDIYDSLWFLSLCICKNSK